MSHLKCLVIHAEHLNHLFRWLLNVHHLAHTTVSLLMRVSVAPSVDLLMEEKMERECGFICSSGLDYGPAISVSCLLTTSNI